MTFCRLRHPQSFCLKEPLRNKKLWGFEIPFFSSNMGRRTTALLVKLRLTENCNILKILGEIEKEETLVCDDLRIHNSDVDGMT